MNTNPNATKVLCYGDSNTWGQKPDKSGRYAADERWTGRLQIALGDSYYVVEEGLSSRTTDLEYPKKLGRNGKTYLVPCLVSHNPIDVVVLMLGTNDLKIEFNRSAQDIAVALEGLVGDIRQNAVSATGNAPAVVLVSPILVDSGAPAFKQFYDGVYYDAESEAKSKQLAAAVKQIADKNGCVFIDASLVAAPGEDGIHFSTEAHVGLARKLHEAVVALKDSSN